MDTDSDRGVDVTVVVRTYNCRAHLDHCLTSLLVQGVRKEIVVVDDGSRDGCRELVELYAAHHPRLIRPVYLQHCGVPGRARNRGLAEATGRYVYFCDAPDMLAPHALRMMVALADRNGSDIVVGRMVRAAGCSPDTGPDAPTAHESPPEWDETGWDATARSDGAVYQENVDRVTLSSGAVYDDLSCAKLVRRATLERHGIRFDETLRTGAGMAFAVHAYCHARTISVLADADGHHITASPGTAEPPGHDPLAWLRMIRVPIELMARHVPAGPLRDRLLVRHFHRDVLPQLGAPFLAASEAEREKIAVEVADLCEQWMTPGVRAGLDSADLARVAALHDLDLLGQLARVATASLCHHLSALRWHGDRLTITGRVQLAGLDGTPALVLRERSSLRERPVPVTRIADRFTARIAVRELPVGVWDVYAMVECAGARRLARLGSQRDPRVRVPGPRWLGNAAVVPFFTRTTGHLALDVGGQAVRAPGSVRLTHARWTGRRLRIEGRVRIGATPAAVAARRLVWRERSSGQERRQTVTITSPDAFVAETRRFRLGTWDAYLELDVGGPLARFPVKVSGPQVRDHRLRWWRGLARWTARPYATAVGRRLSVGVRRSTPVAMLRRRLGEWWRGDRLLRGWWRGRRLLGERRSGERWFGGRLLDMR